MMSKRDRFSTRQYRDKIITIAVGVALISLLCWQQNEVQKASGELLHQYIAVSPEVHITADAGTGPIGFGLHYHEIRFDGPAEVTPNLTLPFKRMARKDLPDSLVTFIPDDMRQESKDNRYHIWYLDADKNPRRESVLFLNDRRSNQYWFLVSDAR